eukprot:5528812-Pleurochrysis_carterae.AAC.1
MEAVVRTVTCSGPRLLPRPQNAFQPRKWQQRTGFRGAGRYLPDTSIPHSMNGEADTDLAMIVGADAAAAATAPAVGAAPRQRSGSLKEQSPLERWLRHVTTVSGATPEVNVQLGEFSLGKQPLGPLPAAVSAMADFLPVLGHEPHSTDVLQAVRVANTAHRRWYHLVGARTCARPHAFVSCCSSGSGSALARCGFLQFSSV